MTPANREIEPSKKSRHRSPNYPAIGLRAAVGKITAIYQEDKLAATPTDAALKHMGFEKAHGEAYRILSALKSFGLIEETDGRIKLTQRGIDIVVRGEEDPLRALALQTAVIGPEIYRELLKQYQDSGVPSDTALKSELIAVKRFNPNAVEGFIHDFRETLEFAGLSDLAVLGLNVEELEDESVNTEEQSISQFSGQSSVGKPRLPQGAIGVPSAPQPIVLPKKDPATLLSQALVVSIPRNFRVDINVLGDELRREDLNRIKNQFNRWIEGLAEAFDD